MSIMRSPGAAWPWKIVYHHLVIETPSLAFNFFPMFDFMLKTPRQGVPCQSLVHVVGLGERVLSVGRCVRAIGLLEVLHQMACHLGRAAAKRGFCRSGDVFDSFEACLDHAMFWGLEITKASRRLG